MRRFFLALLLCATFASQAWAGCFPSFPSFGRWQDGCGTEWWNDSSLTFYAPFDDPNDPLRLIKGTGSLSFTRATTATYVPVNSTTGYIETAPFGTLRITEWGALIEGQRTNLALQSEDLGTTWMNTASSKTTNSDTAPDGMVTADRVVSDNSASTQHFITQAISGLIDNTVYTYSVYLKAGSGTYSGWARVNVVPKSGTLTYAYVDLSNCTTGSTNNLVSSSISTSYDSWCRVSITGNISNGATSPDIRVYLAEGNGDITFSGDNTSYISVWGAQVEAASFPSSYIPTTTAAVTRNADVLSFSNAGNFYNAAGTVNATFDINQTFVSWSVLYPDPAEFIGDAASGKFYAYDGTNLKTIGTVSTGETIYKSAVTWTTSDNTMKLAKDGSVSTTGPFDGSWGVTGTTYIGSRVGTSRHLFGHVKNIRFWNRGFGDDELVKITQ